jgi:Zn-dependent protease with chaperone function
VARAVALNLLKAFALVALLAAVFGGLGWLIGGTTTALLFAFCSLLAATGVYRYGDRALLGMLGARPFALAEDPTLRSAADTVAAKLGVRSPGLYLIDDPFPRLFSVGRGPTSSTVAISTGALVALRREELEAALAHELAHVRRRDVLVQTFVVLFATTMVELSRVGGWLDRAAELVEFAASPATEPLYPVDPFESEGIARMFKTHPPLEPRVRRLRELGAGSNGRVPPSLTKLAG